MKRTPPRIQTKFTVNFHGIFQLKKKKMKIGIFRWVCNYPIARKQEQSACLARLYKHMRSTRLKIRCAHKSNTKINDRQSEKCVAAIFLCAVYFFFLLHHRCRRTFLFSLLVPGTSTNVKCVCAVSRAISKRYLNDLIQSEPRMSRP